VLEGTVVVESVESDEPVSSVGSERYEGGISG
jgi:hypothetical protein